MRKRTKVVALISAGMLLGAAGAATARQSRLSALDKLTARKGFTLSGEISPEQNAVLQRLASPSGKPFDAAYKHETIRDHREGIA